MQSVVSVSLLFALCLGCGFGATAYKYPYPKPARMPAAVEEPLDELLVRFEQVLRKKAPQLAEKLQPGLTEEQLAGLEEEYGIELSIEIRTLYRWHNGLGEFPQQQLTPLEEFPTLQHCLQSWRSLREETQAETGFKRELRENLIGPTLTWVPVFPDVAGDGYYWDHERTPEEGAVFYNFRETSSYQFYPSLNNVIAGFIECYEKGCYFVGPDGSIDGDFGAAIAVHEKYGVSVEAL